MWWLLAVMYNQFADYWSFRPVPYVIMQMLRCRMIETLCGCTPHNRPRGDRSRDAVSPRTDVRRFVGRANEPIEFLGPVGRLTPNRFHQVVPQRVRGWNTCYNNIVYSDTVIIVIISRPMVHKTRNNGLVSTWGRRNHCAATNVYFDCRPTHAYRIIVVCRALRSITLFNETYTLCVTTAHFTEPWNCRLKKMSVQRKKKRF